MKHPLFQGTAGVLLTFRDGALTDDDGCQYQPYPRVLADICGAFTNDSIDELGHRNRKQSSLPIKRRKQIPPNSRRVLSCLLHDTSFFHGRPQHPGKS
jgi:hypothetical protein